MERSYKLISTNRKIQDLGIFIYDEFVKNYIKNKILMLTKVFNSSLCGLFKTKPTIISTGYNFCTTSSTRHESHPLRNKILSISSFDEFNNFFKDKKQQFDPSCYSIASRALAKILIESKPMFNFQNRESIKVFLSHLQKIDIDALNLQQFSQLLYLLRVIKLDPNNSTSFVVQYIKSIMERSDSKIKELELESTLSRLSYFYQEYSSLGSRHANTLARRINQLLQTNNTEVEFQHLNVNEINLILKGMRCKPQLSSEELSLLRNIIRTVLEKHFDKLSFLELAQVSVGINEVVSINSDMINSGSAEQIHKKVLTNIDEMDEKSIMYILNAKKTNNRTYTQIYRIIFDKILDEIQPNGESSFNELFTLRLFNGISDKIRLSTTTPQNQDKFFAFLRQTITKTPRFIHSFVENYIEKGFFNYKQLLRVQEILEAIPDFHLKLSLLYQLTKRNINIEKLLSLDRLKDIELKDKNLIMMTAVLEGLAEKEGANKEKFAEILIKLKGRFFELYKIEDDTFSRVILNLDNEILVSFYKLFRKDIEAQFPNPFETEQPQRYRLAWLKIYVHGCSDTFFLKKLANQLKDKMNGKDFEFLFRTFAIDKYENKDALSNFMTLIAKRIDLIIADERLTNSLGRLMTSELSSIFQNNSTDLLKSRFWHIISDSFEKIETTKFLDLFSGVINGVLRSNMYDLKFSSQYQTFLIKLLQRAESIKSKYIVNELLQESLKLNLIKRQHIATLSAKLKDSANYNQGLLLKMIESNNFALEGVEMTKNNLYMFLFNLSPETLSFINKNQEKIFSLFEQMKPRQLWRCITHFRLGSKRQQCLVLDTLFKHMNKYTLFFEQFSPIFLGEVLRRNNFDKFYSKIDNVKIFYKNSLEYFVQKRNIQKIPLEDHIELIKAANDFKIRNDDYVHAVFESHAGDVNIWKRELYLVAGNVGVELNKKEIQKLIDLNFFMGFNSSFSKCFNIFLHNEKQLENPGTYLQILINKYNELKTHQKVPIYASHYEYLKKVYPEETKNFEPNHVEKADFCRSLESLNSKALNSLRQTIEEITQEKFVENIVAGNYYYTFRNIALIFPLQSKYHGENNLIKRILTTLTGIEKFALLNRRQTNVRSAVKYLTQSFKEILTLDEEDRIIKRLDQKFEQLKEAQQVQEEPEVEEQTEQKPKVEEQTEQKPKVEQPVQ